MGKQGTYPRFRDEWMPPLTEALGKVKECAASTELAIGETIHAEQAAVGHPNDSEPTFAAREKSVAFAQAAHRLKVYANGMADLANKYLEADRKADNKTRVEAPDDL